LKVVVYVFFSIGNILNASELDLKESWFEEEFKMGHGHCGGGWDMGMEGMKVKERRKIELLGFVLHLKYFTLCGICIRISFCSIASEDVC
jgi:hypothetical protein